MLQRTPAILRRMSSYLLPNCCILCGCSSDTPQDICTACRAGLPWNKHFCLHCALPLNSPVETPLRCGHCLKSPPAYDRLVAPLRYEYPVDRLINRFKHRHQFHCGALLTEILADALTENGVSHSPIDAIVPVPLHWRRQFARGFNQADWLACQLSRQLQIPIQRNIVTRRLSTPAQQGLTRRERLANLKHAFRLKKPFRCDHIALVDDVVTTGSTVNILASLLKQSGVQQVTVWCLARTPQERRDKNTRKRAETSS